MPVREQLIPRLPRAAWVVLGGDALSAVGSGLTLPFLLVYLHDVRGLDLGVAGLAVATVALASLAGNPLGGALADRVGARNTVVFGLVAAAAGAVSVTLVRDAWSAFAAAGAMGFGAGVIFPAQDALLAGLVAPGQRSAAFSVEPGALPRIVPLRLTGPITKEWAWGEATGAGVRVAVIDSVVLAVVAVEPTGVETRVSLNDDGRCTSSGRDGGYP